MDQLTLLHKMQVSDRLNPHLCHRHLVLLLNNENPNPPWRRLHRRNLRSRCQGAAFLSGWRELSRISSHYELSARDILCYYPPRFKLWCCYCKCKRYQVANMYWHHIGQMDTSYFIKAFAASPKAVVPGYVVGGFAYFSIPWSLGTIMGLAALGLESSPIFPTYPRVSCNIFLASSHTNLVV